MADERLCELTYGRTYIAIQYAASRKGKTVYQCAFVTKILNAKWQCNQKNIFVFCVSDRFCSIRLLDNWKRSTHFSYLYSNIWILYTRTWLCFSKISWLWTINNKHTLGSHINSFIWYFWSHRIMDCMISWHEPLNFFLVLITHRRPSVCVHYANFRLLLKSHLVDYLTSK